KIDGYGKFESYPNRDSLQYISKYGLDGVKTILRSTLRKEGYCEGWNALVQLGLTNDTYSIDDASSLTYAQWLTSYLLEKKKHTNKSIKERVAKFFQRKKKDEMIERLEWLGLFSEEKINGVVGENTNNGRTPAQILQQLIEQKWMMKPGDNDMVVMR